MSAKRAACLRTEPLRFPPPWRQGAVEKQRFVSIVHRLACSQVHVRAAVRAEPQRHLLTARRLVQRHSNLQRHSHQIRISRAGRFVGPLADITRANGALRFASPVSLTLPPSRGVARRALRRPLAYASLLMMAQSSASARSLFQLLFHVPHASSC